MFDGTLNRHFELICQSWRLVEPETKLIDGTARHQSWIDKKGNQCSGMRNASGHEHGIVVKRYSDGAFRIYSSKKGKSHGLSIEFEEDYVSLYLYKRGEEVASFSFDQAFQELGDQRARRGTELNHLTPDDLNPAKKEETNSELLNLLQPILRQVTPVESDRNPSKPKKINLQPSPKIIKQ